MGAWGEGTFDNDTACDWGHSLEEADDLGLIEAALDAVLDEDDYLDADLGSEALAACDTIARLKGQPGVQNSYTQAVDQWVKAHPQVPPADLIGRADKVIDRVLGERSELPELWEESATWVAAVEELRNRLHA